MVKRKLLFLSIIALLGTGTTMALGVWQLGRAAQKEGLTERLQTQAALPPLSTEDLSQSLGTSRDTRLLLDRSAQLQGQWLDDYTVFLDNRQMDQRQGFLVVTPLQLALPGGPKAPTVLVQRGWVPRDFLDRSHLPAIRSVPGTVTVRGRLANSPPKLYEFKGGQLGKLRQNVSIEAYAAETGLPLISLSLLQTNPLLEGSDDPQLVRHWPAANNGVDKHYGYAFQWFLLSALIVGLYVWFQIILPRRQSHT